MREFNFYKTLNRTRKVVQLATLLFLFIVPILIFFEVRFIIGNLYSITVGGLDITDPSMVLQNILLARSFYVPLLISAIIPVIIAFLFGRIFCSWACPYNTILEEAERIYSKILAKFIMKRKAKQANKNPNPFIYWGIYLFLTLLALIIGIPLFTFLSAPGIISSQIAAGIIGNGIGLELTIVFAILLSEVIFGRRFWCKYVCPVGASFSLFGTKKTLHITYNELQCNCTIKLEPCSNSCPFNLVPKNSNLYPYCTNCGLCVKTCEKIGKGALSFSFDNNKNSQLNIIQDQEIQNKKVS
ncbi:MAG: 4Fe-4S binding protein [Melioribacteraceae bacterium]